jgi:hypothetical protein
LLLQDFDPRQGKFLSGAEETVERSSSQAGDTLPPEWEAAATGQLETLGVLPWEGTRYLLGSDRFSERTAARSPDGRIWGFFRGQLMGPVPDPDTAAATFRPFTRPIGQGIVDWKGVLPVLIRGEELWQLETEVQGYSRTAFSNTRASVHRYCRVGAAVDGSAAYGKRRQNPRCQPTGSLCNRISQALPHSSCNSILT